MKAGSKRKSVAAIQPLQNHPGAMLVPGATRTDSMAGDSHGQPVRRLAVFVTVALALMMMSVDSTIVATALHALQQDLSTSINWAAWTITAYALGFVLMLPIVGKMSDRYGRRRVFTASVCIFTLASLACGLAPNVGTLIVLRAIQAAGGAGFTPSATGIIVNHFETARDRYVGLFGSIFPVGTMIGPIFGGLFVTYGSWRGVFLVNVPVGLVIVALTFRFIPRDRPQTAEQRRDQAAGRETPAGAHSGSSATKPTAQPAGFGTAGMLLLAVGLIAGMFGTSILAHRGAATIIVFLGVACVLGFVGFFWHTAHARVPFILPQLIYGRGFGAVNGINVLYSGLSQGVISLLPLYAANRYGIDALRGGTLLIAQGIAALTLSTAGAFALRRTGYRVPILVGEVLAGFGVALLAVPPPFNLAPFVWLSLGALLVGSGFGMTNPAGRNAGLQLAPEYAATLAAVRSAGMQVGAITTVSIITALLAASTDPGPTQGWCYAGAAAIYFLALPMIGRVPEHRGSW